MGNMPAFRSLACLSSRKSPNCSLSARCHIMPSLEAVNHLGLLPTSHHVDEDINSLIRCQDLHKQKKVKEPLIAKFTLGDQGGSHTGPEAPVAGPILHTFGLGWLFFLTVNGAKTYRT